MLNGSAAPSARHPTVREPTESPPELPAPKGKVSMSDFEALEDLAAKLFEGRVAKAKVGLVREGPGSSKGAQQAADQGGRRHAR